MRSGLVRTNRFEGERSRACSRGRPAGACREDAWRSCDGALRESAWLARRATPCARRAGGATAALRRGSQPLQRAGPDQARLAARGRAASDAARPPAPAIATAAVAAALAAGVGRRACSPATPATPRRAPVARRPRAAVAAARASAPTLEGVTPDFASEPDADGRADAAAAKAVAARSPAIAPGRRPPDDVAWHFAQAFVRYEVGKADERRPQTFARLADAAARQGARAATRRGCPPAPRCREAEVLNVVLGEQRRQASSRPASRWSPAGRQRAAPDPDADPEDGWQVAEVLRLMGRRPDSRSPPPWSAPRSPLRAPPRRRPRPAAAADRRRRPRPPAGQAAARRPPAPASPSRPSPSPKPKPQGRSPSPTPEPKADEQRHRRDDGEKGEEGTDDPEDDRRRSCRSRLRPPAAPPRCPPS